MDLYESTQTRLDRWRWITREKQPWDGKMVARFSEDCLIAPVDENRILVVDTEVWLPERRAGVAYKEIIEPARWMDRVGSPGIHIMPNDDLWGHRNRYARAPRPENWDD